MMLCSIDRSRDLTTVSGPKGVVECIMLQADVLQTHRDTMPNAKTVVVATKQEKSAEQPKQQRSRII